MPGRLFYRDCAVANQNKIDTSEFSNPESKRLYVETWPAEPSCKRRYENGEQCGGCSFFAPLNYDYGICCHNRSRHFKETVFEHFTCPSFVNEGWGPHSFSEDTAFHCKCGGYSANETVNS
jgi:hypothetical protein